jgi:Zn finger protein HypA/HybF involved in hydrogenase expression
MSDMIKKQLRCPVCSELSKIDIRTTQTVVRCPKCERMVRIIDFRRISKKKEVVNG